MRIKQTAVSAACLLFFTVSTAGSDGLKSVIKDSERAVVMVINYDEDGRESGTATGFFINSYGHIATNVHVVEGAAKVGIKTKDGIHYSLKRVINSDEQADLFIFSVENMDKSPKFLSLSGKKLESGDSIAVIGNPLGLEHTVTTGIISAVRKDDESGDFMYQISAPISPGSSGSPVLDFKGNVIGVAVMQYKEGQNLNFVMPAARLSAIMGKNANLTFKQYVDKGYCFYPAGRHSLIDMGYRMIRKKKHDEALRVASASVKKYPKFAPAFVLYSYALLEADREDEALKAMRYAVRMDPKRKSIFNDLGGVYQYMEIYDLAAESYYREIKNYPDSMYPYYNLAVVYMKNDMEEDAIAILNKGIQKAKNPSDLYYKLAEILLERGDRKNALGRLKKAIEYDRNNSSAYYLMGAIAVDDGDKISAIDIYNVLKGLDTSKAKKLRAMIDLI